MHKPMPVGVDDFKKVRENYYFLDKTNMIRELIDTHAEVTLITRPRRFGKTLAMSMLDHFFSVDQKQESTSLFKGLAIERAGQMYMNEQGKYPVISLTLKDFHNPNWASMYRSFRLLMQDAYSRYMYILDGEKIPSFEKEYFNRILNLNAEPEEYQSSIQRLSKILSLYWQIPPIILIDEYDAPLQIAYQQGFYDDAILFWKGCFNAALKTNPYLSFAVMTGVLRIAKESIFSDLNNLDVCSILSDRYNTYFGFTKDEVKMMAEDLGFTDKLPEIQKWYDGYRFGDADIYNPWSVIKYVKEGFKPNSYWINTSSNAILKDLLHLTDSSRSEELRSLLTGNAITTTVNEGLVYSDIGNNESALYTMLLTTGYLTIERSYRTVAGTIYSLRIPNQEIREVYTNEVLNALSPRGNFLDFIHLPQYLLAGNTSAFEATLQKILLQIVSVYDTANRESFYQGLMIGLTAVMVPNTYELSSNRESGLGRFDLALFPTDIHKAGVIMEFKVSETNDSLEERAREALHQIAEMQYLEDFKARHISKVWKYGIAFCGKQVKILQGN